MPPGRTAREGGLDAAAAGEDGGVDGAVRPVPVAARVGVGDEDLVATVGEHGGEQVADEAVADDEDTASWHLPGPAQDARERLHHRAGDLVHVVRQLDPPLCANPLARSRRGGWSAR